MAQNDCFPSLQIGNKEDIEKFSKRTVKVGGLNLLPLVACQYYCDPVIFSESLKDWDSVNLMACFLVMPYAQPDTYR